MLRTLTALKTAAFGLVAAGLCLAGTGAARADERPSPAPATQPAAQNQPSPAPTNRSDPQALPGPTPATQPGAPTLPGPAPATPPATQPPSGFAPLIPPGAQTQPGLAPASQPGAQVPPAPAPATPPATRPPSGFAPLIPPGTQPLPGPAPATQPADQASMLVGDWRAHKQISGQSVICDLALQADGRCQLAIEDMQGHSLGNPTAGTYTYVGDTLRLDFPGSMIVTKVYPNMPTDSAGRVQSWSDQDLSVWVRVV